MIGVDQTVRIGGNPQLEPFGLGCVGGLLQATVEETKEAGMFTTIVWATDGSEHADCALAYAKEFATADGARLFGVHVDERFAGGRSTGVPVLADEDELRSRIRGQMETARMDGFDASFDTLHSPAGRIPYEIADFANSVGADVIVVGTRGHSPIAGALLGSVAQGLLHWAPCPVLAVPPVHALARA